MVAAGDGAEGRIRRILLRKFPRHLLGSVPILYASEFWDSVVSQVLGTERSHLNPVREALRADDGALHRRLLSIRKEAGLPEEISALCVFDVGERSKLEYVTSRMIRIGD
ncbi:hypothetical protein JOJ86_000382 [Rhodococcus percolatus]|uniref:DUF6308 family protein n=1 Tax=Rhodococcus opacus TaxID=37919 RepID=A0A1B1KF82_RHOOP|nr:DUF6308 family protein [Rhodococcus opacus]ANS31285.1 hypothetical protein R1CP_33310 [Rhodococcus opacus]MBA8961480.1 hypothetical protein [Rhodococcus opacus]MBP2202656.1 hypothetical protein [Rhodococcus opacus]MCZ4587890.1 DUF6308 family protein [Rhodococcus opacus]WLF47029.1 DUF6308 family protein [Rhodococcus opacus]